MKIEDLPTPLVENPEVTLDFVSQLFDQPLPEVLDNLKLESVESLAAHVFGIDHDPNPVFWEAFLGAATQREGMTADHAEAVWARFRHLLRLLRTVLREDKAFTESRPDSDQKLLQEVQEANEREFMSTMKELSKRAQPLSGQRVVKVEGRKPKD